MKPDPETQALADDELPADELEWLTGLLQEAADADTPVLDPTRQAEILYTPPMPLPTLLVWYRRCQVRAGIGALAALLLLTFLLPPTRAPYELGDQRASLEREADFINGKLDSQNGDSMFWERQLKKTNEMLSQLDGEDSSAAIAKSATKSEGTYAITGTVAKPPVKARPVTTFTSFDTGIVVTAELEESAEMDFQVAGGAEPSSFENRSSKGRALRFETAGKQPPKRGGDGWTTEMWVDSPSSEKSAPAQVVRSAPRKNAKGTRPSLKGKEEDRRNLQEVAGRNLLHLPHVADVDGNGLFDLGADPTIVDSDDDGVVDVVEISDAYSRPGAQIRSRNEAESPALFGGRSGEVASNDLEPVNGIAVDAAGELNGQAVSTVAAGQSFSGGVLYDSIVADGKPASDISALASSITAENGRFRELPERIEGGDDIVPVSGGTGDQDSDWFAGTAVVNAGSGAFDGGGGGGQAIGTGASGQGLGAQNANSAIQLGGDGRTDLAVYAWDQNASLPADSVNFGASTVTEFSNADAEDVTIVLTDGNHVQMPAAIGTPSRGNSASVVDREGQGEETLRTATQPEPSPKPKGKTTWQYVGVDSIAEAEPVATSPGQTGDGEFSPAWKLSEEKIVTIEAKFVEFDVNSRAVPEGERGRKQGEVTALKRERRSEREDNRLSDGLENLGGLVADYAVDEAKRAEGFTGNKDGDKSALFWRMPVEDSSSVQGSIVSNWSAGARSPGEKGAELIKKEFGFRGQQSATTLSGGDIDVVQLKPEPLSRLSVSNHRLDATYREQDSKLEDTKRDEASKLVHEEKRVAQALIVNSAVSAEDLPPAPNQPAPPVNPFVMSEKDALSTFALESESASYVLSRRYLRAGYRPPPAIVRMEEFVNVFDYNYPSSGDRTFAVHTEAAPAPFGKGLTLLKVGVRGRVIGRDGRKPAHLVFVIDASGSMARPDRLPMVREALGMLVGQLGDQDKVSLISYDSRAHLLLDGVSAHDKARINDSLARIECTAATNVLEGVRVGYEIAARHFQPNAVNRVILCSDGVANVGPSDADAMLAMVDTQRRQGIAITTVGVGAGSYNDGLMEQLANRGDGNYVYIGSIAEAHRVFVENFSATLNTIAKDVKIQVAFDPKRVRRYRLIGYENRAVKDQDFRNDKVDAGEIGSGQSATALYELELHEGAEAEDIGTVFVRYKEIDDGEVEEFASRLRADLVRPLSPAESPRFFVAAAVAEFAEILRESPHANRGSLRAVEQMLLRTSQALPRDTQVAELLQLVRSAHDLPVFGQ